MQMTVPAGSRLHGVYLPELRLPEDAAVVLIVRDGRSFVPDDTTRLMRGDQVLLVSRPAVAGGGRAAAARGQPGRPAGQLARGGGRADRGRLMGITEPRFWQVRCR